MFIFCFAFSISLLISDVMLNRSFLGMAKGTIGERTISVLLLVKKKKKKTRDDDSAQVYPKTGQADKRSIYLNTEDNLHVLNYVIDEKDNGWTLSRCMFIHQSTCPVFTDNELRTICKYIQILNWCQSPFEMLRTVSQTDL